MKKKELAKKAGLDFNEIDSILSEKTLKSFEIAKIIGGANQEFCTNEANCLTCSKQDNLCKQN
jgi:hypothetical protein